MEYIEGKRNGKLWVWNLTNIYYNKKMNIETVTTVIGSTTVPKALKRKWVAVCNGTMRWDFLFFSSDKCTVKQFCSLESCSLKIKVCVFYLLLYTSIYCGYPFELPQQTENIQMSTSNICSYRKDQKKNIAYASLNNPLMKPSTDLFLTYCILNRLSHTIYWKSPISILGTSGYEIYIFLEKNG